MRSLIWCLLLASCSKGDRRPAEAEPRAIEAARPEPAAAKPSAEIPAWAPLTIPDGKPAVPTPWQPNDQPTLVVFSASWCPGCTASAHADRELARTHGKRFQIGVSLQESDEEFTSSRYAQALTGVPVWNQTSTTKLIDACDPVAIPSACLYDRGKAVWTGGPARAVAVLEAHASGKLDEWLAASTRNLTAARRVAEEALRDPAKVAEVVALTTGAPDWQNSFAWDLVDRDDVTPREAALAVALSRDAVAADGGIDFAHLDTYALALAKAGRMRDAAYVGERVIAVCEAVQGKCTSEKRRALEFIESARKI